MSSGTRIRRGWLWLLLRWSRSLQVRASAFALLAVAIALLAPLLEPPLPRDLYERIGLETVRDILEVLASSMLVVATFSLGTLISAFAVASSSTTPRVTELLMEDTRMQNAIGVFVGAFLFSLAGLIGLGAGFYGERGGVLLFLVSVTVVIIVVAVFLRWVELVARVGRVPDAIDRTVRAARVALEDRHQRPLLGATGIDAVFRSAFDLTADSVGYLRHLDVPALQAAAEAAELRVQVPILPGDLVGPGDVLCALDGEPDARTERALRAAFDLGPRRTFDLDPRYGLVTLAEIGCKALSPGVHDPGTAINVAAALARVLAVLEEDAPEPTVDCPRVSLRRIDAADLVDDAYAPLIRSATGEPAVLLWLLKSLAVLARSRQRGVRDATVLQADNLLALVDRGALLAADVGRLQEAAGLVRRRRDETDQSRSAMATDAGAVNSKPNSA